MIGHMKVGNEWRNVIHYEFPSYVPTTGELQEAVDELDGDYKTGFQAIWPNEFGMDQYEARRVDLPDLPSAFFTATAGTWIGTASQDLLPLQTALLVTWKAPTAFPRTTRSYLPAGTEADNDTQGDPNPALITIANAFAVAVINLSITAQVDARKVAVKYTGTPRSVTTSNTIVTFVTKTVWASVRKRRIGI